MSENQYVTFIIGNSLFGIKVASIKEVLYLDRYTEMPDSLPYMKGVIDLRGEVVPLIDARIKFGMPERSYDSDTVVMIFNFNGKNTGLIVDGVRDVVTLDSLDLQERDYYRLESDISRDYVEGVVKFEEELLIILSAVKILHAAALPSLPNTS